MFLHHVGKICIGLGLGIGCLNFHHQYLQQTLSQIDVAKQMMAQSVESAKVIESNEVIYRSLITYPQESDAYAYMQSEKGSVQETIYYGDSEDILDIGVGQYMGSGIFGEGKPILLAGHNGTNFKGLQYIEEQEKIYVTTDYGSFVYQVYETEIMKATDFLEETLYQNQEILIMYTCYPFTALSTEYRYFVYAEKVDGPIIEEDTE